MLKRKNDIPFDPRLSDIEEQEYLDILKPFEFYEEFEAEAGVVLKKYVEQHCHDLQSVSVLEPGSGTGVTTLELLKAGPQVHITAVDHELKLVDLLKAKFGKIAEFKDRVTCVHADLLEFLASAKDGSYDAFASVYTLHKFTPEYRRKVFALIARKLKPGGIFIKGDKYARDAEDHKRDFKSELANHDKFDDFVKEAEKADDKDKAAYWRRLKQEGIEHALEDDAKKMTVKEQVEVFDQLGFSNVAWGQRHDLVVTVSAIKG